MMQKHIQSRPWAHSLLFCLLLAVGTAGCVADWQGRPLLTEPSAKPATTKRVTSGVLDPDRVDERIAALEAFLEQESSLRAARAQAARELLTGYRRILETLNTPSRSAARDGQRISALLFDRLVALEERYFQEGLDHLPSPEALRNLSREKTRIRDAFLSGDHEDVVQTCRRLEEHYGADTLSAEIGLCLAVSLSEIGEVNEAIRVGERILPALEGRPGSVDLRSRLVAWYLESGRTDRAREHVERLVDAVNEDRRLLERAKSQLKPHQPPWHGQAAESPPVSPGEPSSEDLDEILRKVDALVQQKAFDQAKLLLIRAGIRMPEGPQNEAIERVMKRLEREREAYTAGQRREEREPTLVERSLEEVRRLVESEKYEEAFQHLDRMEPPEGDSPEVQVLRDRAATGIIGKKRDEAAKAFLMAKNSSDPDRKEEHLRTAYHLLKGLVDRFPESPLLPKVQSNLDTVREAMEQAGIPPKPSETP